MPKKICIIVSIILCLFVGTVIFEKVQAACHNKIEYSSFVSIEEILDIEEIHMMMYPYKGIAEKVLKIEKKNGDTSEKPLYKVLYNGHAVIGTKEKISASVLDEEKTICIHIPEILILSIIFLKKVNMKQRLFPVIHIHYVWKTCKKNLNRI